MALDLCFTRMLAYEQWANRESLRSLIQAGDGAPQRAIEVMAHIIGASHVWLARLQATTPTIIVWPVFGLNVMPRQLDALKSEWRNWLRSLTTARLGETVSYVNSKGEAWSSKVRDILTHLTLHSAYHRGQIATLLARAGHMPASTDYIHAVRQNLINDAMSD
jgi:uncharacterized damage-inducible protein DinB